MTDADRVAALIVDDNAHMRSILITLLHAVGVEETRQAVDGAEALALTRRWQPTFFVIDQHMQPMSGIEFARRLRREIDNPCAEAPIIMLTAHTERAIVETARDAGIDEILAKPISAKALMRRLHAITHERRPFVRAADYVGPDRRRRRDDPHYNGPRRRLTDRTDDTYDLD
jgi:CheY-like chemotaxis protein